MHLGLLISGALACVVLVISAVDRDVDVRPEQIHSPDSLPWIGFGTAGLGGSATSATLTALQLGCSLIDSAQAKEWYDERAIGDALDMYNQSNSTLEKTPVTIVTKIHPRSFERTKMEVMLSQSMKNFRRTSIEVVLLHSPWCWRGHCSAEEEAVSWKVGWRNLEEAKDQFDIGMIGVSNFSLDLMKELVLFLSNRKVAVVQNWMDPFHQDKDVRAFAREHNIQYMAYSSFGTQWGGSRKLDGRNPVLSSPVLQDIGQKHDLSVPQVVLAWLAAEGVVALPRARSLQHNRENFHLTGEAVVPSRAAAAAMLDSQDLERIRELDGTLGEPWD